MKEEFKRRAVICDLDSTLCDTTHRSFLAEGKRWMEFHDECHNDDVYNWCVTLLEAMQFANPDLRIIFVTARPERVQEKTMKWLKDVFDRTFEFELHMKPPGWNQGSALLKKSIYYEKIAPRYDVLFVLEDEHKVVQMWRSIGLNCLQPLENHFE